MADANTRAQKQASPEQDKNRRGNAIIDIHRNQTIFVHPRTVTLPAGGPDRVLEIEQAKVSAGWKNVT